jgi:hypothetical protein
MSWYWNEIGGEISARYATSTAVWVSYLLAAGSLLRTIVGTFHHDAAISIAFLLQAGLFLIIGIQISRLSRSWALCGLFIYVLDALIGIVDRGSASGSLAASIVAVIFAITYVNAVRGAFAYHKYLALRASASSPPSA